MRDLDPIIAPQCVAVVGASTIPGDVRPCLASAFSWEDVWLGTFVHRGGKPK